MQELSIFIDESGSDGLKDQYYLLTLVFHEQKNDISKSVGLYESSLAKKGLPNIPFHASPLLNGHDRYTGMEIADRKRLLFAFRVFIRHMPIKYTCIALKTKDHPTTDDISNTMRRQLVDFLFDSLSYFQSFDAVKIYYDNGQQSVAEAVHKAVDYVLAKDAITYRGASPINYRLCQIADYICTMEFTALKYADKTSTSTDEKFFGSWSQFKRGILKEIRLKRI
ncbi:MAG: DUF3800 domain-containing protein [Atopobium minutum]|uniref:DUF3800 domain-containing protein n=1 Tax=Atopobium minutum 10063974 TaxID=997872 RepID=N2BPL2_9ACTN|nr:MULTISPECIES: DUF3800 domain-containing protein [Atopobium]EMZ40458.1 hypothetical protein HMPREF1091_01401 [Atopobium minutum 10063974]MBS4873429.1 DUF3800 domain-containing protein [Atopobium minutum]MDU4970916.1 DUF3800 domain-containing protein [Atopobium minutum]MDU5357282.1 DUF3800 domain-containing protein [Atopobium minutum]MDU5892996.1 DUF3800 domain-containing protein [Atopobium minutum]